MVFEASEAPRWDASIPVEPSPTSVPPFVARTRRAAILGFAETVKDAPFQDDSWELWAMNGFHRLTSVAHVPEARYSLWFDLHTVEYTRGYGQATGTGDQQLQWLRQKHPFPIYMQDQAAEFPSVETFPLHDLIAKVGRDYFTSTIAYCLAYALAQDDIAEVGLWGIDLVHGTEWGEQRPCAEYWIGRIEAAGIKVTIHEQSALLKQRARYAYEVQNPLARELKAVLTQQCDGLYKSVKQHEADMEAARGRAHTDDGALQALRGELERLEIWERGGRV